MSKTSKARSPDVTLCSITYLFTCLLNDNQSINHLLTQWDKHAHPQGPTLRRICAHPSNTISIYHYYLSPTSAPPHQHLLHFSTLWRSYPLPSNPLHRLPQIWSTDPTCCHAFALLPAATASLTTYSAHPSSTPSYAHFFFGGGCLFLFRSYQVPRRCCPHSLRVVYGMADAYPHSTMPAITAT